MAKTSENPLFDKETRQSVTKLTQWANDSKKFCPWQFFFLHFPMSLNSSDHFEGVDWTMYRFKLGGKAAVSRSTEPIQCPLTYMLHIHLPLYLFLYLVIQSHPDHCNHRCTTIRLGLIIPSANSSYVYPVLKILPKAAFSIAANVFFHAWYKTTIMWIIYRG